MSPEKKTTEDKKPEKKTQPLATPKRTDARAEALRANLRKRKEWAKSQVK